MKAANVVFNKSAFPVNYRMSKMHDILHSSLSEQGPSRGGELLGGGGSECGNLSFQALEIKHFWGGHAPLRWFVALPHNACPPPNIPP